ncbi:pyridoxamine 5'-phosphate oxidase family protein [Mycobacterium sp. LTG2003]
MPAHSPSRYGSIAFTATVVKRQETAGSSFTYGRFRADGADTGTAEALDGRVRALVAAAESFFIATVTPHGWPYLQHRGGPAGFVRVLDSGTIAFADYVGNEQFVTVGNLDADDRTALIFVDYPTRTRAKVFGRATVVERADAPELVDGLCTVDGRKVRGHRAIVIRVEATDVNCRRNIPALWGEASVRERVRLAREGLLDEIRLLKLRNRELEDALRALRVAGPGGGPGRILSDETAPGAAGRD